MHELLCDKHLKYILDLNESHKEELYYHVSDYLRANATYWATMALYLLGKLGETEKLQALKMISSCYCENEGSYGGTTDSDPHIVYTHVSVLVLHIVGRPDCIPVDSVCKYVKSLENEDGSFNGDAHGEVDIRFSYCAIATLKILGRLDDINISNAKEYILKCRSYDGGFGNIPGAESHAVFCAVGALSIIESLNEIDCDLLGEWLCERQMNNGGLNGRPQKDADICYSWWVLSSLKIINRLDWISREEIIKYILSCQDVENGGFSSSPENEVDLFHTMFGLSGLSLLKFLNMPDVDARFCIPAGLVE